jgi:hypothetical protein
VTKQKSKHEIGFPSHIRLPNPDFVTGPEMVGYGPYPLSVKKIGSAVENFFGNDTHIRPPFPRTGFDGK